MKKISGLFISLLLILSCDFLLDDSIFEGETGDLIIIIEDDGLALDRTIVPVISMDAVSYDIEGEGPMGASFSEYGLESTTFNKYKLSSGLWEISVDAKNVNGTIIGEGDGFITIITDYSVTVEVPVSPLLGYGSVDFYMSWPVNTVSSPVIIASISASEGGFSPYAFLIDGDTATFSSDFVTGYYELGIVLMDSDIVVWSFSDDIRIIKDETTIKDFIIESLDIGPTGNVNLSVETNMENPLDITFSGYQESLSPGSNMTVYSSVSETPDSYQWYLNGDMIIGAVNSSITIGSNLDPGSHRLTLVVEKGETVSSEGFNFVVSQAISLDVEVYGGVYPGEVSWVIKDNSGTVVVTGNSYISGYTYSVINLDPGVYTITGTDSYGDGWNGAYVTITSGGLTVLNQFTFTSGYTAEDSFSIGSSISVADLLGFWTLYVDWTPTDSYTPVSLNLLANYTFEIEGSYAGMWSYADSQLVLSYDNGIEHVGNVLDINYASGTMTDPDGVSGFWYINR